MLARGDRVAARAPNGVAAFDLSEYADATRELAEFFGVSENEFTLTNGTDEAIQVLVNTFVDDGDEVVVLKPSYAMYRFYAEVAGAAVRRLATSRKPWRFHGRIA